MTTTETVQPRILLVDDEPNLLTGLTRHLRNHYDVHTAGSGADALAKLRAGTVFDVIVSDRHMPEMDGVTLLAKIRQLHPDTVRVLLTGQADLESTIASVNEGNVFRFLRKPCAPDLLRRVIDDAVQQFRLITAERVLLEQTLRGSIKTLTEILALANPVAFGRATRVKQYVTEVLSSLQVTGGWELEVAAMLSQIACITLPPGAIEKYHRGEAMSPEEQTMLDRMLVTTNQLLSNIPRLEGVREILSYQFKRHDGEGPPESSKLRGDQIPWGSRVLKIALDYDVLEAQGQLDQLAIEIMRGRKGWYDPVLLKTFAEVRGQAAAGRHVRELDLARLRPGMILVNDLFTKAGTLLVARGQEINPSTLERLRNFSTRIGIQEPVRVAVPAWLFALMENR